MIVYIQSGSAGRFKKETQFEGAYSLLPVFRKGKGRTFKEFKGVGEDTSWKEHENNAVKEYRQNSGGYYRGTND